MTNQQSKLFRNESFEELEPFEQMANDVSFDSLSDSEDNDLRFPSMYKENNDTHEYGIVENTTEHGMKEVVLEESIEKHSGCEAKEIQSNSEELCSKEFVAESAKDTDKECIICYESLSRTRNMCITECGHEFCFSCMMKHVQRNNGCPICRSTFFEEIDDDADSDNEDEYSEVSGSERDSDNEDEDLADDEYSIEQFETAFVAKGYGLKDALSMLMYKFSKTDEKYNKTYINQLEKDIDDINDDLQREFEERCDMEEEDTNIQISNESIVIVE